jgi:hypothetical protein
MDELRLLQTDNPVRADSLAETSCGLLFEELFAELVSMDVGSMDLRLLSQELSPLPSLADLQVRNRRRRRRRWARTSASLSVVGALVIALLVLSSQGTKPAPAPGSRLAAYIATATQVSDQVLEQVGVPADVSAPRVLVGRAPLADEGKPAVVYIGAEYCPYCAVARWALVIALSKFGTFSDLGQVISSASSDVDPSLESWSFHASSYASPYLSFAPAETETTSSSQSDGFSPLDALSPLQRQVLSEYDSRPGVPETIPFIDVDDRYLQIGASADASVLEGLTLDQIAADLTNPSSPVAQALDGSANYLIATLCEVAGQGAAAICGSGAIARAEALLGGSSATTTPSSATTAPNPPAATTTASSPGANGPAPATVSVAICQDCSGMAQV